VHGRAIRAGARAQRVYRPGRTDGRVSQSWGAPSRRDKGLYPCLERG